VAWTRVLEVSELPVGAARAVSVGMDDLLVCRTAEDTVHAVENVCSHDDAPLGAQELDGPVVTCPRHGARFDVTTGAVLRSPAPVGIETFPARLAEGWVEVDLEA
jgi:3-phenylpropionate/trans-cinnamate dioxygenase ferredoxin subunit